MHATKIFLILSSVLVLVTILIWTVKNVTTSGPRCGHWYLIGSGIFGDSFYSTENLAIALEQLHLLQWMDSEASAVLVAEWTHAWSFVCVR